MWRRLRWLRFWCRLLVFIDVRFGGRCVTSATILDLVTSNANAGSWFLTAASWTFLYFDTILVGRRMVVDIWLSLSRGRLVALYTSR